MLEHYRDYFWWGNLRPCKILNALRYLAAKRRPAAAAPYLPPFYMFETGNVCQLSCAFCSQGNFRPDEQPQRRLMSLATFEALLHRIRDSALILDLFKHGEPLLNPELPEIVALAYREGVRCRINSSLNARLTPGFVDRLCRSGLYKIICAIDGVTQESYQRYRRDGNLRLALDNAARILHQRSALGRRHPRMAFRMLVFEWNHHQVEDARLLAKQMGFDEFRADEGMFVMDGRPVRWNRKARRWSEAVWPLASVGIAPNEPAGTTKSPQPCPSLLSHFVVHADGRAAVCCHSHREDWLHESLLETPLETIWNSPRYRASRAYTLGIHSARDDGFPQCRQCPWF